MKEQSKGYRRSIMVPSLRARPAALAAAFVGAGTADAQACSTSGAATSIFRFFVGGAEGDAFGTIVYNGARQAAADTGAQVDYVFSGWSQREDGAAIARGGRRPSRRHRDDGSSRATPRSCRSPRRRPRPASR